MQFDYIQGAELSFSDLYARVGRPELTWAIICLLVILLSGCDGATPPPEPVTITFIHPEVDTGYYEPLVQKFNERYPDVAVELRPRSWDQLGDLGAGDADVLVANPFVLGELQAQGEILSLDPFIMIDTSLNRADFYPGTVESLTSEGKTWAIPAGVNIDVMYYSRDLFDQYDASYPELGWTWDDFLNDALAIRDPDTSIFGYTTTPEYFDSVLFIYQHGGRIVDNLQDPTRTTFDDPLTIEALEWYANLFHEYGVAPTPEQARRAFGGGRYTFYQGLRNGKVGMWILPLSDRGGLTWPVEWYVNWMMAPLPRDARSATDAWVEGYAISSQAQHLDVCWQWISFLSQQMTYRLMPVRKSLAASAAYEQQVGGEVAAVARASMEQAVLFSPRIWTEFGAAMDIFEQAVGQIIDGDTTPQEAMDWAQREAESINP